MRAKKQNKTNKKPATVVLTSLRTDILPLREGHTLVIPKAHYSRVSDLPPEYAGAVGQAVTKVAHGLTKGEGMDDREFVRLCG